MYVLRSDYSYGTKENEKVHIFQTVHALLFKIKKGFDRKYLDALFDPKILCCYLIY